MARRGIVVAALVNAVLWIVLAGLIWVLVHGV